MVVYTYNRTLSLKKQVESSSKFSDGKITHKLSKNFIGHIRSLGASEVKTGKQGTRSTHRVYTKETGVNFGDLIGYRGVDYRVILVDLKEHFDTRDNFYQIDLEVYS